MGLYVTDAGSDPGQVYPLSDAGLLGDPISIGEAGPSAVAFSPDGTTAYVPAGGASAYIIDVAVGAVIDSIAGLGGVAIAITPDGTKAYVVQQAFNAVEVLDLVGNTLLGTFAVGNEPIAVAISPDGTKAYVTNLADNTITPVDVASDTPGADFAVGDTPDGVAFTPDGTKAYVCNAGDDTVTPIDVATDTPGTPFAVGSRPLGVAFTPDGTKAYVCNQFSGDVTPVDATTDTPAAPISGFSAPDQIAISPDGATAYVTTNVGVQAIDIATDTLGVFVDGGGAFFTGIAYSPLVDVVLGAGLTIKIYDLGANELADISAIALEKSLIRVANGPRGYIMQAPASDPLLTDIWEDGDGLPILGDGGNRKLVVWEDADPDTEDPIFHGRIFGCERDGTENERLVTITAFDPWVELGFESDERAGRMVRDGTTTLYGDPSFLTPKFTSSVPDQEGISGPDLIQQVLTYSQNDPTTNPIQGEGPLPIDLVSGEWDLDVPPALDLNPVDSADWPVMIGDFIQQLIATNAVDFDLRPIRPGTGLNLASEPDDYIMVVASAKSTMGDDLTGTVHFDYLTGSFNAKQARHVTDFSKHCAHLWYELGPRLTEHNWRGDITPMGAANADLIPDYDASAAKYGGPDTPPGYDSWIRVFDSLGTETSSRPLYEALYRYEIKQRLEPRQLLYITPADGDKALFTAPQDFDVFDLVQIKTGPDLGKELDEAQRVYGYTKTWTRENVASIGQLQTSADVA